MDFKLRPWSMDDKESLAKYANNWEIAKNLTDKFPHPYTLDNAEAFINMATSPDPLHILTIDVKGEACGGIGLHPQQDIFHKNAEMGYWLAQPFWGNGIMTKAIAQMVEYGFENFDINRIFARPFGSNIGSQKILEKNGFILEAKFEKTILKKGTYEDELVYAIRR